MDPQYKKLEGFNKYLPLREFSMPWISKHFVQEVSIIIPINGIFRFFPADISGWVKPGWLWEKVTLLMILSCFMET